jgi:hypothetical protein
VSDPIGVHISYVPGIRYRLVGADGCSVSVVRRYLEHGALPAGWYLEAAAHSLALYIGTEETAKQVIVAQAAALGLSGIVIP